VEDRVGREHDGCGRQDDAVGNDAVLDVGGGDGDERGAEERGYCGVPSEPEAEHARGDKERRRRLDERVAPRDSRLAVAAAPA
jgi:hypothetical protein